MRLAITVGCLLLSASALAQEEVQPQEAPPPAQEPAPPPQQPAPPPQPPAAPPVAPPPAGPPPAYGYSPRPPMDVRVSGLFGFQAGGAVLSCDLCNGTKFGFEGDIRLGAEIVMGPGLVLTPEAEIPFSYSPIDSNGLVFVGIEFGTRFGFMVQNLVVPYFQFHVGYMRGQSTGCSGSNCGDNGIGFSVGAGAEFFVGPTTSIGPFIDVHFASFEGVTFTRLAFGPTLTTRY